jgi:hypothetical protein
MANKIYLAARIDRRHEMEVYADLLVADGHEVTAKWIYGGECDKTREDVAIMDAEDVKRADTLVLFTEPYGTLYKGGARHTEFGMGYAWGHRCMYVGDSEQVFCHLPGVLAFASFKECREYLRVPRDQIFVHEGRLMKRGSKELEAMRDVYNVRVS